METSSPDHHIIQGDALRELPGLPDAHFQAIIADPPYYQVLLDEAWDNQWATPDAYLDWLDQWLSLCRPKLRDDGLVFLFGQHGKREHTWLHACSRLCREWAFHDLVVWDRVVGYNDRSDSFTPQYEMILVLRKTADATPYFDKDAVRVPYDEATIQTYLRDKRYPDPVKREAHLRKGKYATNILRVPSLKGQSKEKIGHPSQKPIRLIEMLVLAATRPGDCVLDPFAGSGTTAAACARNGRRSVGIELNADYAAMARKRLDEEGKHDDQGLLL
ncbi:MAG: site-specific DNA-methyltransferase [Verrucomicrobia bacterium]|nr:site-specific DNA-methyltransferase [Verrucomicrobiota bacterium]